MGIVIDSTEFSTVVYCDVCKHWVVSANNRGEALVIGAKHETNVHPDETRARKRLAKSEWRERQHADDEIE
jgi:hypothetical protein